MTDKDRRPQKRPRRLNDFDVDPREHDFNQTRKDSVNRNLYELITFSFLGHRTLSIVFTEDGFRKTVPSRKDNKQISHEDGSCPDPNSLQPGDRLYCYFTPTKCSYPCILLAIEDEGEAHDPYIRIVGMHSDG